jgi:hypothetical protein
VTRAYSGSGRETLEALAARILEKENSLKNAFEPGKGMPSVRFQREFQRAEDASVRQVCMEVAAHGSQSKYGS